MCKKSSVLGLSEVQNVGGSVVIWEKVQEMLWKGLGEVEVVESLAHFEANFDPGALLDKRSFL